MTATDTKHRTHLARPGNRRPARLSVGFLLLKRFTLSAFANFVDILRLAADDRDRSRQIHCSWRVISADFSPIQSSCGISIQPHEQIGDLTRFNYIVVVGGLLGDEILFADDLMSAHLRRAAELRIPLVGLCTGSFALHSAGLMDGYRCCVSWFHDSDFVRHFNGLRPVSDQIFVVDRDRFTCSGGINTAHLAAFIVERHLGKASAAKSMRIMMFDEVAPAESPQPALKLDFQVRDKIVQRSLLLMEQNLDVPLTVQKVAARLQVDKRRLERRFRLALEMSPFEAYTQIRLSHARHMLAETSKSVALVASETGYCDASHFGRMFRKSFGLTPQEYRGRSAREDTIWNSVSTSRGQVSDKPQGQKQARGGGTRSVEPT